MVQASHPYIRIGSMYELCILFLKSIDMVLFVSIFFILLKAVFSWPILILISCSFLPSDVATEQRHLNFSTFVRSSSSMFNVHFGIYFDLVFNIVSVFLLVKVRIIFLFSSRTVVTYFCRFCSFSAFRTVSSACVRVLMFLPPFQSGHITYVSKYYFAT